MPFTLSSLKEDFLKRMMAQGLSREDAEIIYDDECATYERDARGEDLEGGEDD